MFSLCLVTTVSSPIPIMQNQTGFIIKVLIISAAVSIFIKYGGPNLGITATPINALILVFLPTLILAIALMWRAWQQGEQT